MYRMVVYPTPLSGTAVSQLSSQIVAEIASRGVSLKPPTVPQGNPQLYAIGDSITYGAGVSTPWPSLLSLVNQQSYTVNNYGIGGMTLLGISGSESNRVAPQCANAFGPNVAIVYAGTNDFNYLSAGVSADSLSTFAELTGEIQTLRLAGCKVFVGTMISRGDNANNGQTWDANKNAYDALILTGAKTVGADGIIDFAANPLLGADGANSDAYFNADHIHPLQTGQALLASAASNSLNYYFGSKLANPTVVTSNAYQMLSGDGAVTAAPTANANYTMPDCVGPSGESYTISNPQSAFAVTIAGKANQPINGLTTAITVPSNSTVVLRDVPNPKTSSGCHWVM